MPIINKTLTKIIHGEEDFCCLCFKCDDENFIYIHDKVEFDDPLTWEEVLQSILGKEPIQLDLGDVTHNSTEIGDYRKFNILQQYCLLSSSIICSECKTSALYSYRFIKTCRENMENVSKAIKSIAESFENLIEDYTSFDTLCVALNTDNFTSQQYYDVKKTEPKNQTVLERFENVIQSEKRKKGSYIVLEVNENVAEKQRKRRQVDFDIPLIPTKSITVMTNNPQMYKCKVCNKMCREETLIRNHYFKNHQLKNVKCSKCPKQFISKDSLQVHEEDYHSQQVCSQCGKHFSNRYVLQKHEINHNLKLMCQLCGRVYRSKEAFYKHLHDNICSQKMRKSSRLGTYECNYCNKKLCTKPYLAKHIKYEHENAIGYKCKFCSKNFYTPSRLEAHIVKHTLEKKFRCDECGKFFGSKMSLLYHTRLHTGEKPYECEHCEKAFLSASRRLDHIRRHHLPPSLECNICKAKFKGTSTLLRHKKGHSNPNN